MNARGRRSRRGRVGLALAGGGPVGAMYELGALHALEEAVDGLALNAAWSYVGVSAGSFIAACLANGLTTRELLAAALRGEHATNPFRPEVFFTPAYGEFARRGFKLPRLLATSLLALGRRPTQKGISVALNLLAQALPVAIFDNEPIREYMNELFTTGSRTDDFRMLRRRLTVVAADLDTGTSIRFGAKGWDHVPISRAVQASTALPGVYPPVPIEGRQCVDGVLLKTVHASVALEQGAKLLFCINPLVPVDVSAATGAGRLPDDILVQAGLPAVLSQTFRTIIHSRLEIGLSRYAVRYPDTDIVLLAPRSDEYEMFFSNVFSFRSRRFICERGYDATRRDLFERAETLAPILARHGYRLRLDVLADDTRDLWRSVGLEADRPRPRATIGVTGALNRALRRLEADYSAP